MTGADRRLIKQQGTEYTVRNSTGGGDRSLPQYSDDGTLKAVTELRGQPRTVTDSGGNDVEADVELRAIPDGVTLVGSEATNYPSKLVHPDGTTYRVLRVHTEDGGVNVLPVVID